MTQQSQQSKHFMPESYYKEDKIMFTCEFKHPHKDFATVFNSYLPLSIQKDKKDMDKSIDAVCDQLKGALQELYGNFSTLKWDEETKTYISKE
jgi:hypothetical protein